MISRATPSEALRFLSAAKDCGPLWALRRQAAGLVSSLLHLLRVLYQLLERYHIVAITLRIKSGGGLIVATIDLHRVVKLAACGHDLLIVGFAET